MKIVKQKDGKLVTMLHLPYKHHKPKENNNIVREMAFNSYMARLFANMYTTQVLKMYCNSS